MTTKGSKLMGTQTKLHVHGKKKILIKVGEVWGTVWEKEVCD